MISKALEEYIKIMYVLQIQKGDIRVTDIANEMGCSKASVNKSLKILKENKLVDYETYGEINLTLEGNRLARKVLEAQDIVYLFLTEILKVEKQAAEIDANNIKNSISDDTLNKLAKYTHDKLGLISLDCGYNINNDKCVLCSRRAAHKINRKEE